MVVISVNTSVRVSGCYMMPSDFLQGIPLHPSFQTMVTILDKFSLGLPNHSSSIIISPPHVVPCSQYSAANHSPFLPQHLLSLVPRVSELLHDAQSDRTVKVKAASQADSLHGKDPPKAHDTSQSMSSGVPSTNGSMDAWKWSWPGYLSFGRGSSKRSPIEESQTAVANEKLDQRQPTTTETVEVDKNALDDAISEDTPIATSNTSGEVESKDAVHVSTQPNGADPWMDVQPARVVGGIETNHITDDADAVSLAPSSSSSAVSSESPPSETPRLEFSFTDVYLADPESPLQTRRRRVYYTLVSRLPSLRLPYS